MSGQRKGKVHPSTGWRKVRGVCCWGAGALGVLAGAGQLSLPDRWPNDRLEGAVLLIGSFALFPPVLRTIRQRVRVAASAAVPVIYAVLLVLLAALIGAPLTPTAAEQSRLQQAAMHQASGLLIAGQPDAARSALRKFIGRRSKDAQLAALLDRIEASKRPAADSMPAVPKRAEPASSERQQDPAAAYVERVQVYWMPEVRAMPETVQPEEEAVGKLLSQLNGLVVDIQDGGSLSMTSAQEKVRDQLKQAVSRKQAKLLPSLRRGYAETLDAKLFRHDVRVTASGPRSTVLRLTGGMFSLNANVEDTQNELASMVRQLRFGTVEYRWSPYLGETLRYDLRPPSDRSLGLWVGDSFENVFAEPSHTAKSEAAIRPHTPDPACVPALAAAVHLQC